MNVHESCLGFSTVISLGLLEQSLVAVLQSNKWALYIDTLGKKQWYNDVTLFKPCFWICFSLFVIIPKLKIKQNNYLCNRKKIPPEIILLSYLWLRQCFKGNPWTGMAITAKINKNLKISQNQSTATLLTVSYCSQFMYRTRHSEPLKIRLVLSPVEV